MYRIKMKYKAVLLEMMCVCTAMLLPSADAGRAPQMHVAGASCRPKELTALTKSLVDESLTKFDDANGNHLGTWSPGFPQLQVHDDSPVVQSRVQCSLIFMAQGLGKVLEDQRSNLNPGDVSLHRKLEEAIFFINMLAKCLKSVFGEECSPRPPPPVMPQLTFERKQWSHTLLKTSKVYLQWLEHKFGIHISKVKGTNKKGVQQRHLALLEGSRYLL